MKTKIIYNIKGQNDSLIIKLISLTILMPLLIIHISCSKCPNSEEIRNTYYVNQEDLPFIIPYNDASKVRFIKNGTDTIIFTSQGLQNTYKTESFAEGGCTGKNKSQQVSLKMKNNINDSFSMYVLPNIVDIKVNDYSWNGISVSRFTSFYPLPILSYTINNIRYDSIKIFVSKNIYDSIIFKPRFGILKIVNKDIYELIP